VISHKKIAVVVHDAGASQILFSLIQANFDRESWHIITNKNSPAHKIALQRGLKVDTSYEEKKLSADFLFYGTSWQNQLQTKFVDYANDKNIISVAFLENWENYKERFKNQFPSFICVHDDLAYEIALKESLPNLIKMKNYSTVEILNKAKDKSIIEQDSLLILSEPTKDVAKKLYDNENYWGFTEKNYLKTILENFNLFHCNSLTIRLHPSDTPDIYHEIMKNYINIDYRIEKESELIDDLLKSKIVIGINTVALYYAHLLGKISISYIPSQNRPCNLPMPLQNQIKSFEQFKIENFEHTDTDKEIDFGIDFETLLKRISR